MAKKSTKAEVIERVKLIIDFLLDGFSRYEIMQYTAEEWGIATRQTDEYIKFANNRIRRLANKAEEKSFDKVRCRLERQYRRAVESKDGHLARLLIQDMRKLYGFDKPIKAGFVFCCITLRFISWVGLPLLFDSFLSRSFLLLARHRSKMVLISDATENKAFSREPKAERRLKQQFGSEIKAVDLYNENFYECKSVVKKISGWRSNNCFNNSTYNFDT